MLSQQNSGWHSASENNCWTACGISLRGNADERLTHHSRVPFQMDPCCPEAGALLGLSQHQHLDAQRWHSRARSEPHRELTLQFHLLKGRRHLFLRGPNYFKAFRICWKGLNFIFTKDKWNFKLGTNLIFFFFLPGVEIPLYLPFPIIPPTFFPLFFFSFLFASKRLSMIE